MRYLALNEVLALHGQVMAQPGGAVGILNLPALESALAQPLGFALMLLQRRKAISLLSNGLQTDAANAARLKPGRWATRY